MSEIALIGKKIGIAFQLKDDLFDYGKKKIGKPTGIDLREKKLTLPFIYALNNSSNSKRKWLINSVKNSNEKEIDNIIEYEFRTTRNTKSNWCNRSYN